MSQVQQVLQQVSEARLVGEHIETLKRSPGRSPYARSISTLVGWGIGGLCFWQRDRILDAPLIALVLLVLLLLIDQWLKQRVLSARDRMWRAVIKHEAPELYAKVKKPGE